MLRSTKYFICVASLDHINIGKKQGFMQACHGKLTPLKRLIKNDYVVFYANKHHFEGKDKLQAFVALAKILDDKEAYQVTMSEDFKPYRKDCGFIDCKLADIHPLLDELTFIDDKKRWGMKFRYGFFEIPKGDFEVIAKAMQAKIYE